MKILLGIQALIVVFALLFGSALYNKVKFQLSTLITLQKQAEEIENKIGVLKKKYNKIKSDIAAKTKELEDAKGKLKDIEDKIKKLDPDTLKPRTLEDILDGTI
jgi:peptidoglycan hydrolase CwlO-like protein